MTKEDILLMDLLKIKADKWDALDEAIGNFYLEEGDEDYNNGDLTDIGEIAAMAFGYL